MTETNVFELTQPGTFSDPLTEVLRNGARTLLGQAVEAEVAAWLSTHTDKLTDDGRRRLVRHGHLPEREIVTGIGAVAVRCPRVRDRVGEGGEHIRFSSTILPPYARRSKSLEVLIPILYLKGISTGDFEEALIALLGKDAGGLSASTIGQLKEAWSDEHTRWSKRDLSAKRYVYFWVDGIHVQARLEEAAQCLLVIIGATPEGKKELVGLIDGVRESAQSWKELLLDLKRRGLAMLSCGKSSLGNINGFLCRSSRFFGRTGGLVRNSNPSIHIFGLIHPDFFHRFDGLLKANGLDKKGYGLNCQNQQCPKANYERRSIIPTLIVPIPCVLFGFLLSFFGCEWSDNKRKFRSPALIWIGWVLFLGGVSLLFDELLRGMPANLF